MDTLKGFASLPQVRQQLFHFLDQQETSVFFIVTPMDNGLKEYIDALFKEQSVPVEVIPQLVFTNGTATGQVMEYLDKNPAGNFIWIDAFENLLEHKSMAELLKTLNTPGEMPKLLGHTHGKIRHEIEFSGKLIVFVYSEEYVSKPLPGYPGIFVWWSIEDTILWSRWKSRDLAAELAVDEGMVCRVLDFLETGRDKLRATLQGGIPRIRVLKQAITAYSENQDFHEVLKAFHNGFDLSHTPGIYTTT